MAYSLLDEPGGLDATDLNRIRGTPVRARSSILGYNEIMWNKGRIENQGMVDDLDLDSALGGDLQDDGKSHVGSTMSDGATTDRFAMIPASAPTIINGGEDGILRDLDQPEMATLMEPFQVYGDFANFMSDDPVMVSALDFGSPSGIFGQFNC